MKRNNRKITILTLILLLSSILLIGCLLFLMITDGKTTSILSSTEQETETEVSTQTEPVVTKPLSYLEKCELDYVEPPLKRTREEAVEKIKEAIKSSDDVEKYLGLSTLALIPSNTQSKKK